MNRMQHIVLLGDSSLDNKYYVEKGNPSIIDQLQLKMSERGWKASSVAQDGHSISHICQQSKRIPPDSTHLVVSVGSIDFNFVDKFQNEKIFFIFRRKRRFRFDESFKSTNNNDRSISSSIGRSNKTIRTSFSFRFFRRSSSVAFSFIST